MTRALHIGVPAASSSKSIVLRRSSAQSIGEGGPQKLRGVCSSTVTWLSMASRWQMRHSVSHVRLNNEFLESNEDVDLVALSKSRPLRTVARPVSLRE